MKVYIASTIKNKKVVQDAMCEFLKEGHQITVNWTLDEEIPQSDRALNHEKLVKTSIRDFKGISSADAFVLFSEPSEGRSMYVEFGVALAGNIQTGAPQIFLIGENPDHTIFYFHPVVRKMKSIKDVLEIFKKDVTASPFPLEGAIEEFKALRSEMLQTMSDRFWGQTTYAVLFGGILALGKERIGDVWLLNLFLVIPFLLHTTFREQSRLRMANYINTVLEPKIPGMFWEKYLQLHRIEFGEKKQKGFLPPLLRIRHIIALSGLYLIGSITSLVLGSQNKPILFSSVFLLVVSGFMYFWKIYDNVDVELQNLRNHVKEFT